MSKNIKRLINTIKSSTLAKGTILLICTGLITKLLGFYNRIFLTRLIGVSELGVYQLSFPIFILSFAISCEGMSTALTRHTARHIAGQNAYKSVSLLGFCCTLSVTFGLVLSFILRRYSSFIAGFILKNSDCAYILYILACALPAMCIKSCINSYLLGINKPALHGISHLIEQLARIATLYMLAYIISCDSKTAAFAAVSAVIGEYIATLFAICAACICIRKQLRLCTCTGCGSFRLTRADIADYCRDYIPITVNDVISTLFSSIEAILLPAMLYRFYADSEFVMEIYGSISGIVIPFLLFPATITTAFGSILLPSITRAATNRNTSVIKKELKLTIGLSLALGVITIIGYMCLGEIFCVKVFKSELAGQLLKKMCILCPFIYLSGSMHTVLIGLGFATANLVFYITSISIRILVVLFAVPRFGIGAYLMGMWAGYIVQLLLILKLLKKKNKCRYE